MLKAFFLGGAMAATFILLFSFMGIFGSMVSVLTPYKCAASTAAFALPSYQCCQFAFCSADFVGLESSLRLPVWHQAHGLTGSPQSVGLDIREFCSWAAQRRLQILWWVPPLTNAHAPRWPPGGLYFIVSSDAA